MKRWLLFSILLIIVLTLSYGVVEVEAADGDESSESITNFNQTLADDVLFYPDTFYNDTVELADGGDAATVASGDYTDTHTDNGVYYDSEHATDAWVILNFTVPTCYDADGFKIVTEIISAGDAASGAFDVLNDAGTFVNKEAFSVGGVQTKTWGEYIDANYLRTNITIRYRVTGAANCLVGVDYSFCYVYHCHYYDDYAESFTDIGDWSVIDAVSVTSDGDIGTLIFDGDGDNDWDVIESDTFTAVSNESYLETRFKVNHTSYDMIRIWLEDSDSDSAYNPMEINGYQTSTSYVTHKWYLGDMALDDIVKVLIKVRMDVGEDVEFDFDYIRIGPADEMGFQHDGSTTAGIDSSSTAGYSSDGSDLNITNDGAGTGEYCIIEIDTTATEAALDTDYYPFLEVSIGQVHDDDSNGNVWGLYVYDSTPSSTLLQAYTDSTGIHRFNIDAAEPDVQKIRFYARDPDDWFTVEYLQIYSIANFTYSQHVNSLTTDYYYVSGGSLVASRTSAVWQVFMHDPALTVDGDLYTVWNLTLSDSNPSGSTDYTFRLNAGGDWSGVDDETRGATLSGTIIDFDIYFYYSNTLSEIKFIEDATAPDILDKYIDPPEPDNDEEVTITTVTSDAVEVYKCTINAIVYPSGFSDVDYEMTETDQEHVWTYDFSTLTAGYYLFQLTANDGANTYSEYITVRVRVAEIVISPISFFGAGDDFAMMTVSFDINRDCSYSIYEASDAEAESETHTGSVTEGWNNIAWDKLTTEETAVNFSIKFTNGSLSTWVNGSYSVAQTTFYVERATTGGNWEWVWVSGYITKHASYSIYEDGSSSTTDTGTIDDNEFIIRWSKNTGYGLHNFSIQFTNGSQTCWYNHSYDKLKYDPDQPDPPWDPGPQERQTIAFWTGVGVLLGFLMVGGVSISYFKLTDKLDFRSRGK